MSMQREQFLAAFNLYGQHVDKFEKMFTSRNKLPREKDWTPIRLAVRDHVIGLVVSRKQIKDNVIDVDVFLSDDPDWLEGKFNGTKFLTIYLLSQAYKSGSSMSIRFSSNVEGGTVPVKIMEMAEEFGVTLNEDHIFEGIITPKEARQLYMALTGFSPEAERKVMELSLQDKIAPERICYMVHHLTYTKEEMESILLGTEHPESILLGKTTPEEYLLYQDVMLRTRDVLLGGMLDRKLKAKEVIRADGSVLDLEGNDRRITIGFDPRYFAKVYSTQEETPIPWTTNRNLVVPAGHRIIALLRARDFPDFECYFDSDVKATDAMVASYKDEVPTHFFVVYPRNVLDLETKLFDNYSKKLEEAGATVMICPETTSLLDRDVMQRLKESEVMRHDIGQGGSSKVSVKSNRFDFNASEITFIALPPDFTSGPLTLSQLVTQAVYDENELYQGVNKYNVRSRYHLVNDRMQFLAHQALCGEGKYDSVSVSADLLAEFTFVWKMSSDEARKARLLPGFWTTDQTRKLVQYLVDFEKRLGKLPSGFKILTDFLKKAAGNEQVVIAIQNKHSHQDQAAEPVEVVDLTPQFAKQFVPDWVNDFGDRPIEEVVEEQIFNALNAASRGQPNGVNLGEVPHMVITKVLHHLVYTEPTKFKGPLNINLVYTDGSQAKPFPIFALKERSTGEMTELRKIKPIKMGMISMRHPEMDSFIDQYWFRNIEVSQTGLTNAERDQLCYEITKRKLAEIRRLEMPTRLSFYQTGFEIPLIGFWRAVVEFLQEDQGKKPMLEIIPFFYERKRGRVGKDQYERGERWH